MLKGDRITRTAARRRIIDGVSFELAPGSTATVLGPSGSGKTSLLRVIMGLDRPDAGEVHLDGRRLVGDGAFVAPEHRGISLVFQEFTLFPNLDVADNLAFGLVRQRRRSPMIDELLDLLEIGHLKHRRIDRLSGGEQQRVALARALAVQPRALLMDEPFSNIDNMLRERLYQRLRDRLAEYGITTLIATHDHKEAFYFSDKIMVMKDGVLMDSNTPRLIYEQPANSWVAQFFGEAFFLTGAQLDALQPSRELEAGRCHVVRPEDLVLGDPTPGVAAARVERVVYYGAFQEIDLLLENELRLKARAAGTARPQPGENVGVRLSNRARLHPLPGDADPAADYRAAGADIGHGSN
jgi:iron(III) transport system ATP-binding protein